MIPDVGGNDRLAGRTFFRVVPRLLLNNAVAYGLGNQLSDFLAVQGNEFVVGVQLVELGAKIERVNAWIKSLQHQEMLLAQERVVSFDNLAFQRGGGERSLSADGPMIVPASNRMIQSFEAILSGWIGTK